MATHSEETSISDLIPEIAFETPSSKRLKAIFSVPSSSSIGKSIIEGEEVENERPTSDSELNCCGICFSDEGSSIRGRIDSCDHYFCFVCIMEWAKVESKCPMCKRRFSTIRRPRKDRVFLSERVINVPVRDQIYHHFGNATVGPSDPYSDVQCSVCVSTKDDNLLLLCDLCDTASHTYCVGLGSTVPEGDWFCQDCSLLRTEHAKNELDIDCHNQTGLRNFPKMPTVVDQDQSLHQSVKHNATYLDARTLLRCRNVRDRIRALRENWNAFRNGSLSFSSSSVDCGGSTHQRRRIGDMLCCVSVQQDSPCSGQDLTVQKSSSSKLLPNKDSYDTDRAWRMMDAAKTIEKDCKRTRTVHRPSKNLSRKFIDLKESGDMSCKLFGSNNKLVGIRNHGNMQLEKHYMCQSLSADINKHNTLMTENRKPTRIDMKRVPDLSQGLKTGLLPGYSELPSSRKVQTSVPVDANCGNAEKLPEENLHLDPSDFHEGHYGPHLISRVGSAPVVSNGCLAKLEFPVSSSSSKIIPHKREDEVRRKSVKSKAGRENDAKCEIQSLVKLNLKLLSKDKKLAVNVFKEVARLATHSILAACGLENPKLGAHSFPNSVCHHTEEVRQLRRSTLMHSSCRECFFVFVKDVVNTIMLEKTDLAGISV